MRSLGENLKNIEPKHALMAFGGAWALLGFLGAVEQGGGDLWQTLDMWPANMLESMRRRAPEDGNGLYQYYLSTHEGRAQLAAILTSLPGNILPIGIGGATIFTLLRSMESRNDKINNGKAPIDIVDPTFFVYGGQNSAAAQALIRRHPLHTKSANITQAILFNEGRPEELSNKFPWINVLLDGQGDDKSFDPSRVYYHEAPYRLLRPKSRGSQSPFLVNGKLVTVGFGESDIDPLALTNSPHGSDFTVAEFQAAASTAGYALQDHLPHDITRQKIFVGNPDAQVALTGNLRSTVLARDLAPQAEWIDPGMVVMQKMLRLSGLGENVILAVDSDIPAYGEMTSLAKQWNGEKKADQPRIELGRNPDTILVHHGQVASSLTAALALSHDKTLPEATQIFAVATSADAYSVFERDLLGMTEQLPRSVSVLNLPELIADEVDRRIFGEPTVSG